MIQRMLKRLSAFVLFGFLLLGWGFLAWQASNIPHIAPNQNSATQEHHQSGADAKTEGTGTEVAIARYTYWLMFFTGVLAVATVGLGIATIGLYLLGRREIRHAEFTSNVQFDQTSEQIAIAERTAAASERASRAAADQARGAIVQAAVASDSLAKIQRPYVYVFGVKGLDFSIDPGREATPYVEYSVANYGQTPAIIRLVNAGFYESPISQFPGRVGVDHELVISPVMPPHDRRDKIPSYLPQEFIPENMGVVVDLIAGVSHPVPKIETGKMLFFRVLIGYDGPFVEGYETSALWYYAPREGHFVEWSEKAYNYTR
jgi:hypothetical protein